MSVTFDVATPVGQCRLLAADFDIVPLDNAIFQDETYAALLNLNGQSVRLAAAQAIDVMAVNETIVQKQIRILDLRTNGPTLQKALKEQSDELRRQEYEGSGDFVGFFDFAEQVVDSFSARQRVINEWLRTSL